MTPAPLPLAGRNALVTGAGRGLGRAYALRLARLGANVAIVDIDLNSAAAFGEELGAETVMAEIQAMGRAGIGIAADLSDDAAARDAVEQAVARFGGLDILVNNAGGAFTPFERSKPSSTTAEDTRRMFDVNFLSMQMCSQAAIPSMRVRGGGVIVNVSSMSGVTMYKDGILASYAAAKAAVAHFTRCMAAELGPDNIRVNCIAPGTMMTARIARQAKDRGIGTEDDLARIPLRRFGTGEDCAGVLEFLVTDLSAFVTGQVISVCGGAVLTPH